MGLFNKIFLLTTIIGLASLASRRWGHRAGGWLGGMPWIAGPIIVFVAIDNGPEFARAMVNSTLCSLSGSIAHCLAFAWLAVRNRPWWQCVAGGWAGFFAVGSLAGALALPYWISASMLWLLLPLARRALPKLPPPELLPAIPSSELFFRVGGAVALAIAIDRSAGSLSSFYSGLLLPLPIVGTILPAFALVLYGPAAAVHVLVGFLRGLAAFVGFFLVLAATLVVLPTALAISLAIAGAMAITAGQLHAARRRTRILLAAGETQ
jgi:hypothetical protein